ncbi:MAG: DUF3592 domain-containing protein [Planctomycetota bacterium]|nr:DUF3592 domain-containing protein [Planctomycetota bacterium]
MGQTAQPASRGRSRFRERLRWYLAPVLAAGLGLLAFPLYLAYRYLDSFFWKTAPGRIVESRYEVVSGTRGDSFVVKLAYQYEAGGLAWTGHARLFTYSDQHLARAWVQRIVAEYPVGRAVEVHYNPSDPGDAVLEPRIDFDLVFFFLPTVFGFLLVLLVVFGPRRNA